mmetsp:Transcript_34812/g.59839  ORF Transcript_34812/g.59839 Transcript_34812/m.59839 type:complete len:176 (-) Transcript_34812:72-599(-)
MAMINTSVVHASASAFDYGGLLYNERLAIMGIGLYTSPFTLYGLIPTVLALLSLGFIGICALLGILRPAARVINFFALMQQPNTHVTVVATSKDAKARSTVTMQYPGDPGIIFTSVLCVEVALALANEKLMGGLKTNAASSGGGLTTPTMLLGDDLLPLLTSAGVKTNVGVVDLP